LRGTAAHGCRSALTLLATGLFVAGLTSCARDRPDAQPLACAQPRLYAADGVASWYGGAHHGRLTANGERFDMNALSAAHRELPFGTRIRVTNVENGRSVVVTVNDRGPYIAGRALDLSRRAAEQLGFAEEGTARVRIERCA
jgi:rare lipoprotein A